LQFEEDETGIPEIFFGSSGTFWKRQLLSLRKLLNYKSRYINLSLRASDIRNLAAALPST
jgi:hypothetical protein